MTHTGTRELQATTDQASHSQSVAVKLSGETDSVYTSGEWLVEKQYIHGTSRTALHCSGYVRQRLFAQAAKTSTASRLVRSLVGIG